MNPNAVIFWIFCSLIGYFIGGTGHAALVGLAIALGVSLLAGALPEKKGW